MMQDLEVKRTRLLEMDIHFGRIIEKNGKAKQRKAYESGIQGLSIKTKECLQPKAGRGLRFDAVVTLTNFIEPYPDVGLGDVITEEYFLFNYNAPIKKKGEAAMKKFILLMLSLLLLTGCAASGAQENNYRQISMDEAVVMMEEENDYILLDVRTPQEFGEKHIPGAINIPNETIGTEEIAELPDKSQLILVYCRSGNRSKQASKKLAALGYTNVVEFGGINDWPGEIVREQH